MLPIFPDKCKRKYTSHITSLLLRWSNLNKKLYICVESPWISIFLKIQFEWIKIQKTFSLFFLASCLLTDLSFEKVSVAFIHSTMVNLMFDRRVIRFELSPYYPLVLCSSEHQSILNKSFLEETLTVWTMSAPQFPHLQITTQSASRNPQKRRLKMSHWEMLFCLEGWEKYLEIIKLTFSKLLLDRQLLLRSEPCDDQGEEERNESLRLEEIPYLREERQTTFAAVQTENIERYC